MNKDVIIKKSKLSGKGLFAARDFKKGEVILKWHPKIFTKSELKSISKKEKHYIYHAGRNKYFLMQPPERYVNHSCDANTSVRKDTEVAKRDIKKDEELTSNYNRAKEGSQKSFVCKCKSKNCKGVAE